MPGDIILLHMCTINLDHMMYRFWDIKCKGQSFLSFWEIRKIKIFWKNEKNSWRYYNFTQEYYHKWKITMYDSWDMDCKRQNFFLFCITFCPLSSPPPSPLPKKFWEKNNTWRYHHFTQVYHKWQSYDI